MILDQAHAATVQTRIQDLIARKPMPPVVVIPALAREEAARDSVVGPARRALGLG